MEVTLLSWLFLDCHKKATDLENPLSTWVATTHVSCNCYQISPKGKSFKAKEKPSHSRPQNSKKPKPLEKNPKHYFVVVEQTIFLVIAYLARLNLSRKPLVHPNHK